MEDKPILNRIHKQILLTTGITGTPLEGQYRSALAELMKYKEEDYYKQKYQCVWIGIEEDEKMEERLKELKEKITSFVNDYDVKNFYVDINEDIDLVSKDTYETQPKVNIEIRV